MNIFFHRRSLNLTLGSALALGLAGCAQKPLPQPTEAVHPFSSPTSSLVANQPTEHTAGQDFLLPSSTRPTVKGFTVYGSAEEIHPPPVATIPTAAKNGVTFNFVNASVTDVAHAIFGELLKQNYTVDGGVQGTITLQTTQPLPRDAVIPALETSLKMTNLALIQEADGYHIAPMANAPAEAAGNVSIAGTSQIPGYGYEIIPLKYANADAIAKLIQPLAQNGVQIQTDETRNLLIVAGTAEDRAAIAQNVAAFDVNWLSGMSYALVPLQNAAAPMVAQEVGALIGGNTSPMAGLVRLVAVGQLNAILVVTRQSNYLSQVRDLIEQFDQQPQTTGRQVYVYHLQNADAKTIANLLSHIMGQGNAGQTATNNGAGAITPDVQSEDTSVSANTMPPQTNTLSGGGQNVTVPGQMNQPAGQVGSGADAVDQIDNGNDPQDGADSSEEPSPTITPDEDDNDLLIYATPDQYQSIQHALVQLDVPPKQVMLEAVVAEVDLTKELRYGVQYFFQSGRVESVNTLGTTAAVAQALPGFSALLAPGQNIQVLLDALDSVTHVNVISAPKLLVLNNQPAELDVGDEVPILAQSATSTLSSASTLVNTVQYQNTGVIMHVTPHINDGGLVTLDISQEVSDVTKTTSSSLDSPTISQRKLSTIVAVPNGQTVALGGMIQTNTSHGNSGIPLLDRIPVLGNLFSNKDNSGTKTELLVMITPYVVQSDEALQEITNEVRQQLGDVSTTQ